MSSDYARSTSPTARTTDAPDDVRTRIRDKFRQLPPAVDANAWHAETSTTTSSEETTA